MRDSNLQSSGMYYDSIPVSLRTPWVERLPLYTSDGAVIYALPNIFLLTRAFQVVSFMRWHPGGTRTFNVSSSIAVQVIYTGPVLSCPGMKHCVIWNLRKLEYQNIVHGWAFPRVLGIGPVLRGSFNYFRST